MTVPGVLLTLPLLLLRGGFPGAASDSVTLKEGENLNLHCNFSTPSNTNFTLQWSNPQGFTIFLNTHQVLRDQRYKLLHYSKDELSIQLSNLTVQDEGIYKCFYYSRHVQNKSQNVEILAAPSHPVLEVSQNEGRGIKLSCYTQGGRPQPQISWLLDNGIELPGDTRHQLGADGKTWSTRSTLRILSYSPKVTASCITQHPALGARGLVASVHLQDLPSTGCKQATRLSEDAQVPSPSDNPAVSSSPENPAGTSPSASPENPEVSSPSAFPKDPEVSSPSASPENPEVSSPSAFPKDPEVSSPSASPENPEVSSPSASPENPEVSSSSTSPENPEVSSPSASPENPEVSSPSASPENPEVSSSSTSPENPEVSSPSASPENPEVSSPSASPENPEVSSSSTSPENPEVSSPSTSPENPEVSSPSASPENPEVSSSSASPKDPEVSSSVPTTAQPYLTDVTSNERDPPSRGLLRQQRNLLLPVLVAALVLVLLVIVLLFVQKLKKAHGVWRRENDVSEQTLESYKSRSNEDTPSHEKNGQAGNAKSNMQYVTEGPVEHPEKNPETPEKNPGDKTMARREEIFPCGRETDV
ncbi:cytotoxic and regulatory T-cell molecule [Anomalospiza imberbis]|uniref:cytotoxic and regulatory T-cell molecule n=1 Tax=Anomalospiza imberbis TaxID=187417 RepID=UPI00358E8E93